MENKTERHKLRQVIMNAEDKNIMSKEEVGFVVMLIERFTSDIEKKTKQLYVMQGEIAQLRLNERIVIQLIDNMVAASEREEARQATMNRLRGSVEEEIKADVEEKVEE